MLLETTIDRLLTSRRSLKDFYASPLSAIEKIEEMGGEAIEL